MIQIVLNNPLTMCGYDGAYKIYFGRTRKSLDMSKASDITFSELCQNSICLEIVNLLKTKNTDLAKELIKTIEFVYMNHNNVQQTLNYQSYINSPTVKRMSLNPENDDRPLWGLPAEIISYEWFCRDFVTLMRLDYHLEYVRDTPNKYSIFDVTSVCDLCTLVAEWIRKHITSMITLDMPVTEWEHPFDYVVDVWSSITELIIHSNGVQSWFTQKDISVYQQNYQAIVADCEAIIALHEQSNTVADNGIGEYQLFPANINDLHSLVEYLNGTEAADEVVNSIKNEEYLFFQVLSTMNFINSTASTVEA